MRMAQQDCFGAQFPVRNDNNFNKTKKKKKVNYGTDKVTGKGKALQNQVFVPK